MVMSARRALSTASVLAVAQHTLSVRALLVVRVAGWQSRTLRPALLVDADLVYVMEQAHLERLLAAEPGLSGRVFLLGAAAAASPGQAEIPDPYGQPTEQYTEALSQVTRSVDSWMQRIGAAPRQVAG